MGAIGKRRANWNYLRTAIVGGMVVGLCAGQSANAQQSNAAAAAADSQQVQEEHVTIGIGEASPSTTTHTMHPGAQWYPDAGFGLFLHWGLSSVRAMNISWPMIPGRPLANRRLDAAQRKRP